MRKLKADHDQLEACVKRLQGDEHSAHTLHERRQGESHPWRTVNTLDDLSLYHMHHPAGQTTRWHPFVYRIMKANIPLGWKPSTWSGMMGPQIQMSIWIPSWLRQIYTPMAMWSYVVSSQRHSREALTWYSGLPPRSIDSFDTLVECFSVQYATSRSHLMTSSSLASLRQADDESLRKFIDRFGCTTI